MSNKKKKWTKWLSSRVVLIADKDFGIISAYSTSGCSVSVGFKDDLPAIGDNGFAAHNLETNGQFEATIYYDVEFLSERDAPVLSMLNECASKPDHDGEIIANLAVALRIVSDRPNIFWPPYHEYFSDVVPTVIGEGRHVTK